MVSFIVENSKQQINFNTGRVANVTFEDNCDIFGK